MVRSHRSPSLAALTDFEGAWFKAACNLKQGALGATGMPEKIVERAGQAQLSPVSAATDGWTALHRACRSRQCCMYVCAGKSTAAGGTLKR